MDQTRPNIQYDNSIELSASKQLVYDLKNFDHYALRNGQCRGHSLVAFATENLRLEEA